MSLSPEEIRKLNALAYLDTDEPSMENLSHEINQIMDFVEQLKQVDVATVEPLSHPMAMHQRLRPDDISESSCVAELEALAPLFDDGFYLVPQVIEQGK